MLCSLNPRYKLNRRLSALRSKWVNLAPAVANLDLTCTLYARKENP
jgi:hypothetical protein